jgi:hypothetical protein
MVFVADEIGLGITFLELARTERALGEMNVSSATLELSQAACESARRSLGEISCLLQSPREVLEDAIRRLQAAISESRTTF